LAKTHPVDAFLKAWLFRTSQKNTTGVQILKKSVVFFNFAIRMRFFEGQNADLQGRGAFFDVPRHCTASKAPLKGQ